MSGRTKPWHVALIGLGTFCLGLFCGSILFYAAGYDHGMCFVACRFGTPVSGCECFGSDDE